MRLSRALPPTQLQWEPLLEGATSRAITVSELRCNSTVNGPDRTVLLEVSLPQLILNATGGLWGPGPTPAERRPLGPPRGTETCIPMCK